MAAWIPLDGGHSVDMPAITSALSAGDPVQLDADGVVVLTDGGTMFGICESDAAAGTVASIWRGPGRFQATGASGYNPDRGDRVAAAGSNEVDGGSATNLSIGVIVDADPSSAGKCVIDFDPWGSFAL